MSSLRLELFLRSIYFFYNNVSCLFILPLTRKSCFRAELGPKEQQSHDVLPVHERLWNNETGSFPGVVRDFENITQRCKRKIMLGESIYQVSKETLLFSHLYYSGLLINIAANVNKI